VTDVRDTQLQSKIGPYVDTFLTSMVLSELKGKMPDANSEKRLLAAVNKTVDKMVKHQKADGTFAGNAAWASVLSQGLANKGFARASQAGLSVPQPALSRVQGQVAMNFDAKSGGFRAPATGPVGGGLGGIGAPVVYADGAEKLKGPKGRKGHKGLVRRGVCAGGRAARPAAVP
jgi:hypothetical protein